ncbi:hypothetical protein, partial [Vibrio genomosp. F6]
SHLNWALAVFSYQVNRINMNSIIKDELLRVYEFYCENLDADNFEEYQLLGATKFAKSLAYKLDDQCLLGLASKIEMELMERIRVEDEYYSYMDDQPGEYPHLVDGRNLCKDLFYKQKRYNVDMKEYRKFLIENEDKFISSGLYDSLVKYLNEEAVLHKVYNQVKEKVMYSTCEVLPDINQIDVLFNEAFGEICRKADKHLERQLSKALAANS